MPLSASSAPQQGPRQCPEQQLTPSCAAQLRLYERSKLRYYYAIIECDSVASAARLYGECDGLEFELSACKFDLRFVPDDQARAPAEKNTPPLLAVVHAMRWRRAPLSIASISSVSLCRLVALQSRVVKHSIYVRVMLSVSSWVHGVFQAAAALQVVVSCGNSRKLRWNWLRRCCCCCCCC